ncbi:hypothetical protein ElyMa_004094100 [Elysia marginata]|uniref:Uncharacterized protein n=1 Tax=Elysia marginata TaxID=1093978 RepID=A0AAV4GC83_9GAST|nr:hypothetical protein ElyMa_004094100 [Elysia marginata]
MTMMMIMMSPKLERRNFHSDQCQDFPNTGVRLNWMEQDNVTNCRLLPSNLEPPGPRRGVLTSSNLRFLSGIAPRLEIKLSQNYGQHNSLWCSRN